MATLDWVRKIYEDGMHCAFTDLVRWKDSYYCCFRRAERHAVTPPGDVWIIRSKDLKHWETCGTLTTGLDDRDPHMATDGDRLLVYCGSRYSQTDGTGQLVEGGEHWIQSYVSYTTDGTTWHVPIPIYKRNYWLWHPYRFEDAFYCAAYSTGKESKDRVVDLLKSNDGINWTHLTRLMGDGEGNETGLYRYEDGRLLAAIRGGDSKVTHFMLADPPYTNWTRWTVSHGMCAPVLAKVGDRIVGAGRSFHGDSPKDAAPERRRAHTSVYLIYPEKQTTEHLMDLPSGGDTSYCGMTLRHENTLLISYYSQHEYLHQPGFVASQKPASIYLAQLTF